MAHTRSPLRVSSLKAAFKDFMNATATGGYRTNEGVVVAAMGARGTHATDCPGFDAVRLKYEVPKACTFEQAFRACWNKSRDWREFDLATLRDSHSEFRHLQLPDRVENAIEREAIAGEHERARGGYEQEEESFDAPPIELLHRSGPSPRRRKSRRKVSSAVRGKSQLAREYRAAKKKYHKLGDQLHWFNIKGTLL